VISSALKKELCVDEQHLKLVVLILKSLPEKDRFAALARKDKNGRNIFQKNCNSKFAIKKILEFYPESQRLKVLLEKEDFVRGIPLIFGKLSAMLELLTEYDKVLALQAVCPCKKNL